MLPRVTKAYVFFHCSRSVMFAGQKLDQRRGARSRDDLFSGRVVQTSQHELGSATTSHQTSSRGRGQDEDLGGRLRNPSFDTPPPPLRDGPPPSRQYDRNQPLIREGPNDYICSGGRQKAAPQPPAQRELPLDQAREELLQGQVGGLGGARARHHPGRAAKRPEPRHALRARLPVTYLNVALSRQSEGLSDGPSGPEPEGVRARAARESRAEPHHPGAVRRDLRLPHPTPAAAPEDGAPV